MAVRTLARRFGRALGLLTIVTAVLACSRPAAQPIAVGNGTWRLPAANWTVDGQKLACAGTGWIGATIHGSPDDPDVVWVERAGEHLRLAWPSGGYTARFVPSLEILDPDRTVIFREGEEVAGGCQTGDRGIWQVDAVGHP